MVLTVDIGNSNIVLGVFEGDILKLTLRIKTDATRTRDEYAINLNSMLKINNINVSDIDGAIISSVVPNLSVPFAGAVEMLIGKPPFIVGPGVKTGLDIRIDNPSQLGCDMVVDAVSAIHSYGTPAIVIDMGTATTFSAIGKKGEYLGAAITPGVRISMNALAQNAAQISQINIDRPKHAIGTNTTDSLKSGIVLGYASMLDGIIERFEKEIGAPCNVIATGGLSSLIIPHCKRKIIHDKYLLIKGLLLIYNKNI